MNRKIIVLAFIGALMVSALISTANATPTNRKDSAVGAGVFIHEHDGVPHTHHFTFSVSEKCNEPQGMFRLICKHDNQIDTIIVSTEITSLEVHRVKGGFEAVFTGTANVKMDDMPWQSGWTFTVTAFDLDHGAADRIGITLLNPQGQVQCSAEPTPLRAGNIVIKT